MSASFLLFSFALIFSALAHYSNEILEGFLLFQVRVLAIFIRLFWTRCGSDSTTHTLCKIHVMIQVNQLNGKSGETQLKHAVGNLNVKKIRKSLHYRKRRRFSPSNLANKKQRKYISPLGPQFGGKHPQLTALSPCFPDGNIHKPAHGSERSAVIISMMRGSCSSVAPTLKIHFLEL